MLTSRTAEACKISRAMALFHATPDPPRHALAVGGSRPLSLPLAMQNASEFRKDSRDQMSVLT